jgi:hypothetical protein
MKTPQKKLFSDGKITTKEMRRLASEFSCFG